MKCDGCPTTKSLTSIHMTTYGGVHREWIMINFSPQGTMIHAFLCARVGLFSTYHGYGDAKPHTKQCVECLYAKEELKRKDEEN